MNCLDTSTVIHFLRGDEETVRRVGYLQKSGTISITTLTLCELYKGSFLSQKTEQDLKMINNFVKELNVLTLENKSCREFGEQYAKLEKAGKRAQELDLMIGCITKVNNLTLITRDKKDFLNIEGLKLEVW